MTVDRYWCEHAWLGGPEVAAGVTIEVVGDRLAAVNDGVDEPPAGATPLAGLTVPALANAHSHAFHRVLRGRTHGTRGSFWTWRDLMYAVAERLDPESYGELARAVFAEMALAGVGVVGEFHYVHHRADGTPYDDPNAIGRALVEAAHDVGVRLTLLDTLYLHGGFEGPGHGPLLPEQVRFGDGCAGAWAERVDALHSAVSGPAVVVGAAVHSVRAVDPDSIEVAAAWSERRHAPLHVHVSEQPAEHEECAAWFGTTPIGLLGDRGALTRRTTVVHATHADDHDVARLAAAGAACCLCPTTERDLADGIGPSASLAAAGVPICVGSDSHAVIDLFEEARAVELDERLRSLERGVHPPAELMAMPTAHGYGSLGWPDGGVLAAGGLADFTTIGLDSVRLAGTDASSALAAAVFAASAADVRSVVVAGRQIVRDGRHVTIDVPAALVASIDRLVAP